MNRHPYQAALYLLAVASLAPPARAITYTATLLNPSPLVGSEGRGISAAIQVGYAGGDITGGSTHAVLWNSTAESMVDLNPVGFTVSYALGASGESQVGYGTRGPQPYHALLWNGTAASFVDLDPGTFLGGTFALGASATTQVGYGSTGAAGTLPRARALLWHGTAASAIDLTPALFSDATAYDASETSQVGSGHGFATGNLTHALLWTGTAASAVDLHPSRFDSSEAFGVSGASQVGSGYPSAGGDRHALLWNGTAASAVDLNPPGYILSEARAVSAAGQVGFGATDPLSAQHALMWKGSADSVVDLHPFLSSLGPTFFASNAWGISDNGTIVGTAFATEGGTYAVLWTPVPEPGSWALFACGLAFTMIMHTRRLNIAFVEPHRRDPQFPHEPHHPPPRHPLRLPPPQRQPHPWPLRELLRQMKLHQPAA